MRSSADVQSATVEWPTLAVATLIYGGWLALTVWHQHIPTPLLAVLGGWLIAWQGSLQHETIHGHPTSRRWLNRMIGAPPLCLWLPYDRYRSTHLAHHATDRLTDPLADPESRYLAHPGPMLAALAQIQATLLGRLVFGPAIEIGRFLLEEACALLKGDTDRRRIWLRHAVGVMAVLAWLTLFCHLSLDRYLLCFIYPGAALSLLRSFAEHRADSRPERRVAVVERAPLLGLLYLNNNLHAAHHDHPGAPWWRLPGLYAARRPALLAAAAPVYDGYAEVFRRYLFRPHDRLVHPSGSKSDLAVEAVG
jgi:fatty acid desaturase